MMHEIAQHSSDAAEHWRERLSRRDSRRLQTALDQLEVIERLEPELTRLDDHGLRQRADRLRSQAALSMARDPAPDVASHQLLPECFALVREAARRELGERPYAVQLLAGICMARGLLVEMQTGEGKTLAAVAPVAVHAMAGRGVHVLTYNDYLARRDAAWMGPIYERLGLTVGWIGQEMASEQRRRAYGCDVTYLTVKEAGFDLLRDGLCLDPGERVHRPFHLALVDEADSILIDEARIPLVIAGRLPDAETDLDRLAELACRLRQSVDFETDEYANNIFLTDQGIRAAEQMLGSENLFAAESIHLQAQLRNALHARVLLRRDVDYIVRDGQVELVDELTGRVAHQRQWPDGLQAAVEAKEGLRVRPDGQMLGSIAVQHLIQRYPVLAGMTATAVPAALELAEVYGLEVVSIPTHRPVRRRDLEDVVLPGRQAKEQAVLEEVARQHSRGRPVLVGTISVEESERLAAALDHRAIPCRVLNARNDSEEAEIIAEAGAPGAVTISTNMAGRGTDIRLGGSVEAQRHRVLELGGLCVIGTNRHASRRIDDQLRGRAGRQGDPGSSRFFISLKDDLPQRYGIESLLPARLADQLGLADAGPGSSDADPGLDEPAALDLRELPVIQREIERVQRIVEGQHGEIRKRLMDFALPLERQREGLREWRDEVLEGRAGTSLLAERCPERWAALTDQCGASLLEAVERRLTLHAIDRCWSEHLACMQAERDEVHLVLLDGRDPLTEMYRRAGAAHERLLDRIDETVVELFERIDITPDGVDWEREGLRAPSSTWTYLVSDTDFLGNTFMNLANRPAIGLWAVVLWGPLLLLWGAWLHLKRWRGRRG